MKVSQGSRLFVSFGAMYPEFTTEVRSISYCGKFAAYYDLDDTEQLVAIENIKEFGQFSVNGSRVGIFLLPDEKMLH